MSMIERIKEKARADRKTIVFPEGLEPRTVKACAVLKGSFMPTSQASASWIRSSMQSFRSMRRRCMNFER